MTTQPKNNSPVLILASSSPRRKKLLGQLGYPFSVKPSAVNEHFNGHDTPGAIVQKLALRKARDIAPGNCHALVLGADTIVVHEESILEKPGSKHEALAMLKDLSGSIHQVLTGVALVLTNASGEIRDERTFFETTTVTFGTLEEDEMMAYVNTGSPMDKAGGYGIQDDWGTFFVKHIEGDYNNIVGLPLYRLYNELKTFTPALAGSTNSIQS